MMSAVIRLPRQMFRGLPSADAHPLLIDPCRADTMAMRSPQLPERTMWTVASEFPETFHGSITWTPDPMLPPMLVPELELFGPPK